MLNDFRTLHVAVLCSKRAPGLRAVLHHPFANLLYRVECVVTTELSFGDCDVPLLTHPIRSFYDHRNAPLRDRDVRRVYDQATVEVLTRLGVDTVLLLGYAYVVTEPLLDAFPGSILNIHDADLTIRNGKGGPRYPGLHATRDAIMAGENSTRSSIHVVTSDVDAGPVMARSDPYPVAPFVREAVAAAQDDIVRAYAYAHREWMMRSSWGDLAVSALEQLAAGAEVRVPA